MNPLTGPIDCELVMQLVNFICQNGIQEQCDEATQIGKDLGCIED